jgi:hypothetical protein
MTILCNIVIKNGNEEYFTAFKNYAIYIFYMKS